MPQVFRVRTFRSLATSGPSSGDDQVSRPLWPRAIGALSGRSRSLSAPSQVPRSGQKPTTLEFLGLAGNFGHLNLKDPFDVKKRGSSDLAGARSGGWNCSFLRAWVRFYRDVIDQESQDGVVFGP